MLQLGQFTSILTMLIGLAAHLVDAQSCNADFIIFKKEDDGYMVEHEEVPFNQTTGLIACGKWCASRSDCQGFLLMDGGCARLACQTGTDAPVYLLLTEPGPLYIPTEYITIIAGKNQSSET